MGMLDPVFDTIDGVLAWLSTSLGQTVEAYCDLETADSEHVLATRDGSLMSIVKIAGVTNLVGPEEFERLHKILTDSIKGSLGRSGHSLQVFFGYDGGTVASTLRDMISPAFATAERLNLDIQDLLNEKIDYLKNYCADEQIYFCFWTHVNTLTQTQIKQAVAHRKERNKANNFPALRNAQNVLNGLEELRSLHNAMLNNFIETLNSSGMQVRLLNVYKACQAIRFSVDPDFTSLDWQPYLPGDKIPIRESKNYPGDISDCMWPSLARQLIPRDGEVLNLRTARVGDKIYSTIFIDLFPKEIASFNTLFKKLINNSVPWRISFLIQSDGMNALGFKPVLTSILSFASENNKLINKSVALLNYLKANTDDPLVQLRVVATTWAPYDQEHVLRNRAAELSKAIQSWGYCDTGEISGDPFEACMSSCLGLRPENVATASIAPLSDVVYMLPFNRPASPWQEGAILFRSPDGKPWPYQPGSSLQTTWIDLIYARPGSGKSVLSNSINLGLCLLGGLERLPRIAIIDIGPSSSGLISLLKDALPEKHQHLVAYHRLRMSKDMSINPFDTQLGCRYPTTQERAFLVNFLTLLATPIGQTKSYDGISDMCGLIVDEMYKNLTESGNPHRYTKNIDPKIDILIDNLAIKVDDVTTWWEITDELFKNGYIHEATLAQRYAVPLLSDAVSICRSHAIEDLFGNITAPTGETLIVAFGRMVSSAVREYPILSHVTTFDIGDARVVSLDLDEVAKTGGEAADRQTAIMYMLSRYVLARHYYFTEEAISEIPAIYKEYHTARILEIREDPKRIVFDEFHRTSKSQAVRDQVIVDMREGRKWKVHIGLISQSLDDFDDIMVEFATSVFVMDAGPKQSIDRSVKIFGLNESAKLALEYRVHGPTSTGATFLAQFATKYGINTQLITSTVGPQELWAFNTSADDASIRKKLYQLIGAKNARRVLANKYPTGSAINDIEKRLTSRKQTGSFVVEEASQSVISEIVSELVELFNKLQTEKVAKMTESKTL